MTQEFKLQPGDILVNVNSGSDPWSRIRRWGLSSPYTHVFLYLGTFAIKGYTMEIPFLFESNGRGVVLRSLSERYGEQVVVMRLKPEFRDRLVAILNEAINLASDLQAVYDYTCIPLHIIPRILHEKLGIPIALKYQRDEKMVCSEAVAEIYWEASAPVLPKNVVPLPGDFVELSSILSEVNRGKLSPEWVV
ncbi:hypothetical protein ES703_88603 [subsurface metagenome]